jgi:hypothetical protein
MSAARVGVFVAGLAMFVSGVLLSAGLATAENATGVVFHDATGNGVRDGGESGISGVLVTNGLDVVQTDADGRYTLSVTDETIISIVKPAGYKVPVDKDNLPQFYYLHQPQGTPPELNLDYPGVDPTGPLPASIDFPLMPGEESDQFKAIMIADPQPQTEAELDYVRDDFVAQVIGTDAVFGKTHGDIMFDDLSLFPRYNAIIGQIDIPWYNVPGNHEINFLSPNDQYSTETFKRYYGPTYYAHEQGQALFITLDTTLSSARGVKTSYPFPATRIRATTGTMVRRMVAITVTDGTNRSSPRFQGRGGAAPSMSGGSQAASSTTGCPMVITSW